MENKNIEPKRRKYIPYNCRCEAIGDCRDNGRRYRSLEGKWNMQAHEGTYIYSRKFKLNTEWKGRRLYLNLENCAEENTVYINGITACEFSAGKLPFGFAESEITQYIDIDSENEIKIVASGIGADDQAFVSIFARKFVHIRDFDISFTDNSVKADIFMSQKVPAEITLEAYNDDLELLGSVTEKIDGSGKVQLLNVGKEEEIRLVLLVCGDEVIPYCAPEKCRPTLPKGEQPVQKNKTDYELCKNDCDVSTSGGKIVIKYCGNSNVEEDFADEFNYSITTENNTYDSGKFSAEFSDVDGEYIAECGIEYNSPSLSFYEFFLNIEKDGEFIGQLGLPVRQTAYEQIFSCDMKPLAVCQSPENIVTASGLNFEIKFDLKTGAIFDISKEGCNVLSREIAFEFSMVHVNTGEISSCETVIHKNSRIIASDENHIAIGSSYQAESGFEFSVLWIIFGDGEISVSVSTMCIKGKDVQPQIGLKIPVSEACNKAKIYGVQNGKTAVFNDDFSQNNVCGYKDIRWVYSYGERFPGLLIKGLYYVDVQISDIIRAGFNMNDGGTIISSMVLKAVFCENEDVVREARTVPRVK